MKEFIETFKMTLETWGELTEAILSTLSLLCISAGVIMSLIKSVNFRKRYPGFHPLHTNFRMVFGGWLVVALEFQLAADIVATIGSPTIDQLIKLGAIALIRTFLNYFLNKELKEERESLNTVIEKKNINQ